MLEFVRCGQHHNAENGANHRRIRMLSPHGRGKHLNDYFSERVVLRTADLIQQCRHAQAARIRAYRGNARFCPPVGIM